MPPRSYLFPLRSLDAFPFSNFRYVQADGQVRLAFTQAKTVLNLFRSHALGKDEPYIELCRLFDRETEQGANMSTYSRLLANSVESITATFQKSLASGLQQSRHFIQPETAFELVTWLVLFKP